jgi:hypothetical protein
MLRKKLIVGSNVFVEHWMLDEPTDRYGGSSYGTAVSSGNGIAGAT